MKVLEIEKEFMLAVNSNGEICQINDISSINKILRNKTYRFFKLELVNNTGNILKTTPGFPPRKSPKDLELTVEVTPDEIQNFKLRNQKLLQDNSNDNIKVEKMEDLSNGTHSEKIYLKVRENIPKISC